MQLDAGIFGAQCRPLGLGLLHPVFAEHALAGRKKGHDGFSRKGFRHGDKLHLRGWRAKATARVLDCRPYRLKALAVAARFTRHEARFCLTDQGFSGDGPLPKNSRKYANLVRTRTSRTS